MLSPIRIVFLGPSSPPGSDKEGITGDTCDSDGDPILALSMEKDFISDPNIFVSQGTEPEFPLDYTVHINFKDGTSQDVSKNCHRLRSGQNNRVKASAF